MISGRGVAKGRGFKIFLIVNSLILKEMWFDVILKNFIFVKQTRISLEANLPVAKIITGYKILFAIYFFPANLRNFLKIWIKI